MKRTSTPTVFYKGNVTEKREVARLMRLGHTYEEAVSSIMRAKTILQQPKPSEPSKRHSTPFHKAGKMNGPPADKHTIDADSPIVAAHTALHGRLEERHSGFWLDGRPSSLSEVMRQTNAIRKRIGMKQVGKNPDWKV